MATQSLQLQRLVRPAIKYIYFFNFQEVHQERIALETQLEQLRPLTVL